MRGRPVDYDLVDKLTTHSNDDQDSYVQLCPHLPEMRVLVERFRLEGWWDTTRVRELERIRLDPARGLVVTPLGSVTTDEWQGEIES